MTQHSTWPVSNSIPQRIECRADGGDLVENVHNLSGDALNAALGFGAKFGFHDRNTLPPKCIMQVRLIAPPRQTGSGPVLA